MNLEFVLCLSIILSIFILTLWCLIQICYNITQKINIMLNPLPNYTSYHFNSQCGIIFFISQQNKKKIIKYIHQKLNNKNINIEIWTIDDTKLLKYIQNKLNNITKCDIIYCNINDYIQFNTFKKINIKNIESLIIPFIILFSNFLVIKSPQQNIIINKKYYINNIILKCKQCYNDLKNIKIIN
jgi:hypothetical protein